MNFIHVIMNLYSYVYFNKVVIFMVVSAFILQFVEGGWVLLCAGCTPGAEQQLPALDVRTSP